MHLVRRAGWNCARRRKWHALHQVPRRRRDRAEIQGPLPRGRSTNHLYNIEGWMKRNNVVGSDNKAMLIMAFAFPAARLVNTVGLLLAKFLMLHRSRASAERLAPAVATFSGNTSPNPEWSQWPAASWRHPRSPRASGRCAPGTAASCQDLERSLPDRLPPTFVIAVGISLAAGIIRRPLSGLAYRARGARLLPEGAIAMGSATNSFLAAAQSRRRIAGGTSSSRSRWPLS